jgi:hypothetical protein
MTHFQSPLNESNRDYGYTLSVYIPQHAQRHTLTDSHHGRLLLMQIALFSACSLTVYKIPCCPQTFHLFDPRPFSVRFVISMWTLGQGFLETLTFPTEVITDHLLTLNRTKCKFFPPNKALVCRISGSGQNSTFMYFHFFLFFGFRNCRLRFHAQF